MAKQQTSKKANKQKAADANRIAGRTFDEQLERIALRTVMIVVLIQMAVTLVFGPRNGNIAMVGSPDSAAVRALLSAAVIAAIVGPIAYVRGTRVRNSKLPKEFQQDYRLSAVPITIAGVLVTMLAVSWFYDVLNRAFEGAMFNRITLAILLSISSGVVAYAVAKTMAHLRASGMLYLVVASLMGTLLLAGAHNENPYWWEYSFSHLGMTDSNSKAIFNVGLIFTGILVLVWQEFFMKEFRSLERRELITLRSYQVFRWGFVVTGIFLAMVGIVRFGIGPLFNIIHDVSATGMGVILGLMMLFMPKLNPHYMRAFYYISWLIVGGLVFSAVIKVLGYVNLTGLEMAGFTLASLWLLLFFRNTKLLLQRVAPELQV
ncbi:MAG: hypothetical protein KDD83_18395 [Caldilineaceae bacterium]|nr:hypothetical protein [Caldilineaceae bacterium]